MEDTSDGFAQIFEKEESIDQSLKPLKVSETCKVANENFSSTTSKLNAN